jgi:HSP20 family protein
MKALTPAQGLMSFRKEMDRLFERLWEGDWTSFPQIGEWTPALDMVEDRESITVKLDVPGMEPADLHITFQDDALTVRGEKKTEKEEKDKTYYRSERTYGSFTRVIRLPASVETGKANATFKNGVLTIVMPKVPAAKGTEIPIKVA